MSTTFALAIPHASWLPERAALMTELRRDLRVPEGLCIPGHYREFTEMEHWSQWAAKMWRWGIETGADWFVTLQDDVEVAPNFWEALPAMVHAWPTDFISLASTHSLGPEVARQGRRSYQTPKVVGWGYACPMGMVRDLLAWAEQGNLERFRVQNPGDGEDSFFGEFLRAQAITPRCPVPTIVDHRFVPSTNEGFDTHTHRRSTVTWRAYASEDMVTPSWWQTTATQLPPDDWRRCYACLEHEPVLQFPNGVGLCHACCKRVTLATVGRVL